MKRILLAAALLLVALPAFGQSNGITAGGAVVPGHANYCFTGTTNSDGSLAVAPCNSVNPLAVTVASTQVPIGYPSGATAIAGNGTGTVGAVVGTLAGVANQTTYICGFVVSARGGTATVGPITIAGTLTSSQVYQFASTAAGATLSQTFTPCIPASAANTPITTTTTADGTATAVDVNSWGFQIAASASAYPFTVITGNSTGTTGIVTGTLAGTAGKTTYICGFNVAGKDSTATTTIGPVTVAGTITSSQVYQGSVTTTGNTPVQQNFSPCVPASAQNTAITVATTADVTGTAVDVNAWGFQQ